MKSTVGAAAHEEALPFHLRGNFAPVMDETVAYDLPIQGAVPAVIS